MKPQSLPRWNVNPAERPSSPAGGLGNLRTLLNRNGPPRHSLFVLILGESLSRVWHQLPEQVGLRPPLPVGVAGPVHQIAADGRRRTRPVLVLKGEHHPAEPNPLAQTRLLGDFRCAELSLQFVERPVRLGQGIVDVVDADQLSVLDHEAEGLARQSVPDPSTAGGW
jgi:hypothetical protein